MAQFLIRQAWRVGSHFLYKLLNVSTHALLRCMRRYAFLG
nr:MAG TPA: hypothetical protein [Caudoviricetes sp.]